MFAYLLAVFARWMCYAQVVSTVRGLERMTVDWHWSSCGHDHVMRTPLTVVLQLSWAFAWFGKSQAIMPTTAIPACTNIRFIANSSCKGVTVSQRSRSLLLQGYRILPSDAIASYLGPTSNEKMMVCVLGLDEV